MVAVSFAVMSPASTAKVSDDARYAIPEMVDLGPVIRNAPVSMQTVGAMMDEASLKLDALEAYYDVNDSMMFYDSYGGNFIEMTKKGEGNHCEVWVADDTSFPDGDPRNDEPWNYTISQSQVNHIMEQFDDVIYPTEAMYFGEPGNLTGDNALMKDWGFDYAQTMDGKKTMIVIENIQDENFIDSDYPYYVAGYFSPTSKLYYDRNIIHIDCWDWTNRTTGTSDRPYLYEAVVSHEYQHLLHDHYDEDEDLWLNEGLSMYAEFLCNYSNVWDSIHRFLFSPDNGLIDWGDQGDINILSDYGNAMLFMVYLNDHFGGADFISDVFHCPDNGLGSISECLANTTDYSYWTADDAFMAFRLANLIHSDDVGDGFYNYDSINWSDPDAIELYDGEWNDYDIWTGDKRASDLFGNTMVYDTEEESGLNYDTRHSNVGAYGTDYFWMDPSEAMEYLSLKFFWNGDGMVANGWSEAAKSSLYEESFSSEDLALDGWMTTGSGNPWKIGTWSDGQPAAWCDGRNSTSGEWLRMNTDHIDASSAEDLVAELYMYFDDADDASQVSVYADAGSGWTFVESFVDDVYGTVEVDLSEYAGESELRLAFYYWADLDMYVLVDDIVVYDPTDLAWYSGSTDWVDHGLVGSADLRDSRNSTLTFQTMYEIEEYWDFGFVQVSTDGGETWISLSNDHTIEDTDPSARPLIVENVPGLTGSSDGWTDMEFDLSEYDGQEIMFQFRYVTDWATTEHGWYVSEVMVNDQMVDVTPVYPACDWMVSIYCPASPSTPSLVFDINMNNHHETMRSMHSVAMWYDEVCVVVSPTLGMADYMFGMYDLGAI
jgi:hypothetical protein